MAFNTALCHFLCGVAILSAQNKFRPVSIICMTFVAVFSFVTGLQYLTGIDIGIDRFFIDQNVQVRSSYPGRMAPNTVFYFLLTSGSLLSWHLIKNQNTRLITLLSMGIIVLLLSVIVLAGYLIKLESAYSWWGMSDMAPLTAIGFLILSIGLLGIAYSASDFIRNRNIRFFKPIFAVSVGITLTLLINQGMLLKDRNHIERLATEQSSKAAHIIKIELENDIVALRRMQSRLNLARIEPLEAWRDDARNYVRDNPAYKSLALMDKNHKIYAEISGYKNTDLWRNLMINSPAIDAAREHGKMTSLRLPLYDGKNLVVFFFPLTKNGEFSGFLAAAYDVQEEIAHLPAPGHGLESYLEISDQSGLVFSNKTGENYIWKFSHKEDISLYDMNWTIVETMNGSRPTNGGLIILVFLAGVGLSLVLGKAIWQTQEIRRYSSILKERDERYTRAVNAAQVGLWDWNLQDETLVWSGSAWEVLGAASNEELSVQTEPIFNLIHEDDRAETERKIREGVESEHMFNVEYRTKRLDGKEIWAQSRGKVADFEGGIPTRVSGTLMDITRRKIDELELTRSNQELERFAYVASHDLKAPLRSIDNLAKWVIEDTAETLPPDAKEKLDMLRKRVSRLESLLEDILAYSRAGRMVDEPVEVDTHELVTSVIQSHVSEKFTANIVGHLPILMSPRTPLEQIFGNLLTNACKHHDKGNGTITIQAHDKGYFYEFVVADDGPGIPPEFHARVFEMFQTLQPRDKVDGSGIGMSIIKKLVEWRGGKIWIKSEAGERGTELHFLWPKK